MAAVFDEEEKAQLAEQYGEQEAGLYLAFRHGLWQLDDADFAAVRLLYMATMDLARHAKIDSDNLNLRFVRKGIYRLRDLLMKEKEQH